MSNAAPEKPIQIAVVEPRPEIQQQILASFGRGPVRRHIHFLPDCRAVLLLARAAAAQAKPAQRADLILLPLSPAAQDGWDVLHELKSDPRLRHIPVVALLDSEAEAALLRVYDLHANCCIVHTGEPEQWLKVLPALEHFWLSIATLPLR
jgi:CheY-like chemotaxis protein